jgi:uncharacterized membrane protein YoaK (UPF0700 family)
MRRYLRRLTGNRRSQDANRHLGVSLAFVAGAANAGGFMAIHQYTSHMSGMVSSMADNLVLHDWLAVMTGFGAVAAFMAGAAYSSILINWGRHHRTHSEYAYPLLWEALLLCAFGLMGGYLQSLWGFVPITVLLLCFIMGLQNAIITKISKAEIRTTHMTGMVTDMGIEIGKMIYINLGRESSHYKPVHADFRRFALLMTMVGSFFVGGVCGAFGFHTVGYASTLPLAGLLTLLAVVPLVDDIRVRRRVLLRHLRHHT